MPAKTIHKKILPDYFQEIVSGKKTFELRKDDSDYNVGDCLILEEWEPIGKVYTGKRCPVLITYILRDAKQYGLMEGYCILGIKEI